jgi:photosystem II stability/assembly factor-like uncharacterized protein
MCAAIATALLALLPIQPTARSPEVLAVICFYYLGLTQSIEEHHMTVNPGLLWSKTNAPVASSRTDDIWFANPDLGWAVNSDGQIINTTDGGNSWSVQHQDSSVYLRCVQFSGTKIGWAGTVSGPRRLFSTRDGGANWKVVDNLPPKPAKICGLAVVDDKTVYASGSNDPVDDPAVLKTTDGGATWKLIDMTPHASLLVDIHFQTRDRGWVVGGKDMVACPGRRPTRDSVKPVVLFTNDGGATWKDLIPANMKRRFPFGEWGWKIFFLNDTVAFVSLENFLDGAFLKSTDGGMTWERLRINDRQRNSNLEGIGFISEQVGWVGGWGDVSFRGGFTSQTMDGGANWDNANEVGFRLNRFRFFGNPVTVGYASGDTVYKFSTQPVSPAPLAAAPAPTPKLLRRVQPAMLAAGFREPVIDVPQGAGALRVDVWDRFGTHLELVNETNPAAGERKVQVDPQAAAAAGMLGNTAVLRVTVDNQVESHLVSID